MGMSLEETFKMMRHYGVQSLKSADAEGRPFEVVMLPGLAAVDAVRVSAAVSGAEPAPAADADTCPCGHSYEAEHAAVGCLRGCPHAACATRAGPALEAA